MRAVVSLAHDRLLRDEIYRREDKTRRDGDRALAGFRDARVRHHERSLALLEERLPEPPLVRELREELLSVRRERPPLAAGS